MIVAGFGFRAAATADSLRDALTRAGDRPDALATLADKAAAPAFRRFARDTGLPVLPVTPEALDGQPVATHSDAAEAARGTGSVAEATALAAAGPGARLLTSRVISEDRMATCALATREGT